MHPIWETLSPPAGELLQPGADAEATAAVCALPGYALLGVTGADAESFLQGQLTCDTALHTGHLSRGAHCNAKGRMLSSFLLARRGPEDYLLRLPADNADTARAALGKYIVFSKAEIGTRDELLVFGLSGADAAVVVEETLGGVPPGEMRALITDSGIVVQLDASARRFECWILAEQAEALWQAWSAKARPASSDYWRWLQIRAGIAEVGAADSGERLPQMLNYDLNGAVNFRKGCYTGQEVVARAHWRGKVKRRMIRAECAGPIAAGATVHNRDGRSVGEVLEAVERSDGCSEFLAVVSGEAPESAQLSIDSSPLTVLALPYAI